MYFSILSPIDFQDYTGIYNDLYIEFRPQVQAENIADDIVFEMELVKQIEVNIDYILMLVAKYHKSNCVDKEVLIAIDRAIKSSIELRSKKELIEGFIATINAYSDVEGDWKKFVANQKEIDISTIIEEENLKSEETRRFLDNAFRDGEIRTVGGDIDKIMPPMSRFGGGRGQKRQNVIEKLKRFFEKYFGLEHSVQLTKKNDNVGNEDGIVVYKPKTMGMLVAENTETYTTDDATTE